MDGILPFQRPPALYVQKSPNPWSQLAPTLISSLLTGIVQNRLNAANQRQQQEAAKELAQMTGENELKKTMMAQGYTPGEGGQWVAPKPMITPIEGTGMLGVQTGAHFTPITSPAQEQQWKQQNLILGSQLDTQKARDLAKLDLENRVALMGGKINPETGRIEYAPGKFATDEATGYVTYTEPGGKSNVLQPIREMGEPAVKDIPGVGKIVSYGGKTEIVRGSLLDESGNPKSGILPGIAGPSGKPIAWVATGPDRVEIVDSAQVKGLMTQNEALKGIVETGYGQSAAFAPAALTAFYKALEEGKTTAQASIEAMNAGTEAGRKMQPAGKGQPTSTTEQPKASGTKTVVRTGRDASGRKVVLYSDGTYGYGD